jgi:diguanylate cyclase (GGDEF)-like protein/PAS domain S-box-containing protein
MNPPPQKNNSANAGLSIDEQMRSAVLDHMREGVVGVDTNLKIHTWNQSLQAMTGLNPSAMIGNKISPAVFKLQARTLGEVKQDNCPFLNCLQTGNLIQRTYLIAGRSGREMEVDFNVRPVRDEQGSIVGAMGLLQDNSKQKELQQRLNSLYMKAVLDPLTQVANRAEFDRLLEVYVRTHREAGKKCSVIIADIDFFKGINDNYGHHIGDEALISFAQLLKQFVRKHDFIARFGGEEFVILCANCDEIAAVRRAEDIRFRLEKTPQSMLDGKCMTASFGVSQLEDNDDPTSLFVRADKALLKAKELGRNRVVRADLSKVQGDDLGSGADQSATGVRWRKLKGNHLVHLEFQTRTPAEVLIGKVSHMLPEINAQLVSASEDYISLTCEIEDPAKHGQFSSFNIELDIQKLTRDDQHFEDDSETYLRLVIQPRRSGWFHKNNNSLAEVIALNIRQYLGLSNDACVVTINRAVNSSGRD